MLSTAEILKRVRRIEIKTKGLSNHLFAGEYHSAFKGRGMSFSEVREYQPGDDVRTIDWNVTARLRTPFVKVFEEERELTVVLLVDVSRSVLFGSQGQSKQDLITELCAVLAFSAASNQDKVGLLLFDDEVRLYIPPKKGRSHILRIIRELVAAEPRPGHHSDPGPALEFLNRVLKKRAIAFLASDFISPTFRKPLQLAVRRHDVVALHITDRYDAVLPDVGLTMLRDSETGQLTLIDTGSATAQKAYRHRFEAQTTAIKKDIRSSGARYLQLSTGDDYIRQLRGFFEGARA